MNSKKVLFCLLLFFVSVLFSPLQAEQFERGLRNYYRGELDEAGQNFQAAIEADTTRARPYFFLGNVHRQQENYEDAIEAYRTALDRDPDYRTVRERLADLLFELDEWEQAARQYERLVEAEPRNFDYLYRLGVVRFQLQEFEEARDYLLRARERRPRSARIHYYLGRMSLEKDDLLDALSRFERAIQLNPSEGEFYFYRGLALFQEEDYLRADDDNWKSADNFRRALELGYDTPRTRFMLANSFLNRGLFSLREGREERGIERLRSSISQYQEVLATDWQASNAYHNMGVAYLGIGRLTLARRAVEEAIEIEPSVVFFHDTLGLIHYRLGKFEEALSAWNLVRELDSDYDQNPFGDLLEIQPLPERIREARIRR